MALAKPLWQAEGLGSIFEHSRVRRIEHARDALSPVEQRVYELLWNTGSEGGSGDFRLVYYSLQRIATEARINIKTVRELIPRLMEKGFIRIEHKADVRRNIPTLYRVPGYDAVLFGQKRQNRRYIAKTGKGVFYVRPVSAQLLGMDQIPGGLEIVPREDRASAGAADPNAPADGTTPLSPTTSKLLASAIRQSLGAEPDEALLSGMVAACHENALAATGEAAEEAELLYFTQAKAQVLAGAPNIRNHLAVLRKAVPECFSGDTFRAYRAAAALRREGKRGGAD